MKKGLIKTILAVGGLGAAVCAAKKKSEEDEDGVVSGFGQTALVTGASGGLGRAYAEEFAKHGFDLVLVARSREKLEAAAEEFREKYNVTVTVVDEDLSDPAGGERLYNKVKELGIQVDQLVNNAGAGKMSRVIDADVKSMCPGRILMPDMANAAIADGTLTAAALGRALLADPQWPEKAREGRDEDIRPCIGCNNGCMARVMSGLPIMCAVNAELFNERNEAYVPAAVKKKIAVVGAGIGGMTMTCCMAYSSSLPNGGRSSGR